MRLEFGRLGRLLILMVAALFAWVLMPTAAMANTARAAREVPFRLEAPQLPGVGLNMPADSADVLNVPTNAVVHRRIETPKAPRIGSVLLLACVGGVVAAAVGEGVMSRAKFRCFSVTDYGTGSEAIVFNAVCADEVPENQRYHQYSPSGKLEITVTNPNLRGAFQPGQSYYLDFTPAEG